MGGLAYSRCLRRWPSSLRCDARTRRAQILRPHLRRRQHRRAKGYCQRRDGWSNWANGYQSDGQVNREALGFHCYDRSNPVEGLTVACVRGGQKIIFFANFLRASSSASLGAGNEPTAIASGQPTYAKFCCGRQYRPGTFRFGMSSFVTDMNWSKWGKKLAQGTGTYQYNNCVPDCADGTITPTPATVVLTGRVPCPGRFLFHHMKLYYAGRKLRSSTFCKGPL